MNNENIQYIGIIILVCYYLSCSDTLFFLQSYLILVLSVVIDAKYWSDIM